MNDRDIFSQYIEMINRFEYVSNKGNTIHPSENDEKLMQTIQYMTTNNELYKSLLKQLHSLPPKERYNYLESFFNKDIKNDVLLEDTKSKEEKGIQFIKKNKDGYINNVMYFSVASSVILLLAVIIALFYYYIS